MNRVKLRKGIFGIIVIAVVMVAMSSVVLAQGESIKILACTHFMTDWFKSILSDFKKETGVEVAFITITQRELDAKMSVALTSVPCPYDVVMTNQYNLPSYAERKHVEPLTSYIERTQQRDPGYLSGLVPSVLETQRYKGVIYAIPIVAETTLFYYRQDLFDKAGISAPTTMDQWVEAATKLHNPKQGVFGTVLRGIRGIENAYIWAGFSFSYGAGWFTDDYNPLVNTPGAVKATEVFAELMRKGPPNVLEISWDELGPLFIGGSAATAFDANALGPMAMDPVKSKIADTVAFSAIPKGITRGSAVSAWSFAIPTASENKDAAWKFINWATSRAVQEKLLDQGELIALMGINRLDLLRGPKYAQRTTPTFQRAVIDALFTATQKFLPRIAETLEVCDAVSKGIHEVYDGGDAQEAMNKAAWEMWEIFEKAGYFD